MSLQSQRISASDLGSKLPKRQHQSGSYPRKKQFNPTLDLSNVIYHYINDVPDDVMLTVTEAVMTVLLDRNISDHRRKNQIEELLGPRISISDQDFEIMSQISQQKERMSLENENNVSDNSDIMEDSDSDLDHEENAEQNTFVALNDPVRLIGHKIVKPNEVDAHWLQDKLKGSLVTVTDVLSSYVSLRNMSQNDRELALENMLGSSKLALSQLLSNNLDVVVLFTKLALSESDEERLTVQNEITKLRLEALDDKSWNDSLPNTVDLKSLSRPLSDSVSDMDFQLPENSTKLSTDIYEQFNIPESATMPKPDWPIVKSAELPMFAQPAFRNIRSLNAVQSKVSGVAVNTDENLLVCAPTGAGKTNIALMCITRCLDSGLKAVFISPQKALVQEQVEVLQSRLQEHHVCELSGDSAMSRFELSAMDVIVATPEKWDIVSRKKTNIELLRKIGLVVIDEIHLLHDEQRGGIIENVVLRHRGLSSRLVGLSATLPNYNEVGEFLAVPTSGLFFFDSRFRPVPLRQQFLGVYHHSFTVQKEYMNLACIQKVREISIDSRKQTLIFVHSRKDTADLRNIILNDTSLDENEIGIHHAGMSKDKRALSEALFREGEMRVLVCTATLAWGMNLPAAAVIIKGTQIYNPSSGSYQQLRPQDILQMLGRAGRPGYDSEGLGVIITTRDYLGYVASAASLSLPIESHLMYRIVDSINAEVVLNNIRDVETGKNWLENSFWATRWRADPFTYGDRIRLADIIHSVFLKLQTIGVATYEYPNVRSTGQGELAANFYITPESLSSYAHKLQPWFSSTNIIKLFASSKEFESLTVRPGENGILSDLINLVPIPVESGEGTSNLSASSKISVLLQAYIGRLSLSSTTLQNDTVYIAQSASRLMRAIFELSVELGWGTVARLSHQLYAMVDHRIWAGQSPFRQFPGFPLILAKNAEAGNLQWSDFYHINESDLASVLKLDNPGILDFAQRSLASFPRFELNTEIRSLSSEWIVLNLGMKILSGYNRESSYSGFWLLVETQLGEISYSRHFTLQQISDHQTVMHEFHIKFPGAFPPYLYLKVIGDQWLNYSAETVVNLRSLIIPSDDSKLFTLEYSSSDGYKHKDREEVANIMVSPLIRALEPLLAECDRSVCLGVPPGVDQILCARLIIARALELDQQVTIICPDSSYRAGLGTFQCKSVRIMTVSDAEKLSRIGRKCEKHFSDVDNLICLETQEIGSNVSGYLYEIALTRLIRYWSSIGSKVRIAALGLPHSSIASLSSWIKTKKSDTANFELTVRKPAFPDITILKFDESLPTCLKCTEVREIFSLNRPTLVLAANKSQRRQVARELRLLLDNDRLILFRVATYDDKELVNIEPGEYENVIFFATDSMNPGVILTRSGLATNKVILFTIETEYNAFLFSEPLPLESSLDRYFGDAMIPEILTGTIDGPQSAMTYLSSTFLYRRLKTNPGFYGCANLQYWSSELVQNIFEELSALEIVEFVNEEELTIRPSELCHILVHSGAFLADLLSVKNKSIPQNASVSCIDHCMTLSVATNSTLTFLFELIDVRQCKSRSLPMYSSSLLQVPWVTDETVVRCQDAGISTIMEFIAIEDDELRSTLLGFTNDDARMVEVAEFVNDFPIVDIAAVAVSSNMVTITIERDMDDEALNMNTFVWFVAIGDPLHDEIKAFKRVSIDQPVQQVELQLTDASDIRNWKAWLLCGDYIGADKECIL